MDAEKIQAAIVFHALYVDECNKHDGCITNAKEIELAEKAVCLVNVINVDIESPE